MKIEIELDDATYNSIKRLAGEEVDMPILIAETLRKIIVLMARCYADDSVNVNEQAEKMAADILSKARR